MKKCKPYLLAYLGCIFLEVISFLLSDLGTGFWGLILAWLSLFFSFLYISERYKAYFNTFYPDEYQKLLREKDWKKQFYFQPADFHDPILASLQKDALFLVSFCKIGIILPIAIPFIMLFLYLIIYGN